MQKEIKNVEDVNIVEYNRMVKAVNAIYTRKRELYDELSYLTDDCFEGKVPDREIREARVRSCLTEYDYITEILEGIR